MKNINHDFDDSLRAEYRRSDFGEMIQGKHATTQIEFAELVRLLLACIGEDEGGLKFISPENQLTDDKAGDWTYEIDDGNTITLRYWTTDLESIEEPISSACCINTPRERSELQNLLLNHVRNLKGRAGGL